MRGWRECCVLTHRLSRRGLECNAMRAGSTRRDQIASGACGRRHHCARENHTHRLRSESPDCLDVYHS